MNEKQAGNLTAMDQWFRYWMPYHFEQLEDPRRKYVYLPVNRNYKPLGITTTDHVDYDEFRRQAIVFASDPTEFENVWWAEHAPLYMYNDGMRSRFDYFTRLERLMCRSAKLYAKTVKPPRSRFGAVLSTSVGWREGS